MSVRKAVTRHSIGVAARRIIEQDGVTALSMRVLATALDVKAPSLYDHVKNRDEVIALFQAEGLSAFGQGFAAAGDTNLDWQVDIIDAANFLAGGKFDTGSPASWNEGDFTYDGVVDILDAASFLSNGLFDAGAYNSAPGQAGSVAAVPEPTGLGAAVVALAAAMALRRRHSSRG